jgi:hypothetical protein
METLFPQPTPPSFPPPAEMMQTQTAQTPILQCNGYLRSMGYKAYRNYKCYQRYLGADGYKGALGNNALLVSEPVKDVLGAEDV